MFLCKADEKPHRVVHTCLATGPASCYPGGYLGGLNKFGPQALFWAVLGVKDIHSMCCSRLPTHIKITSQLKCVLQTKGQTERERGTNGHKQLFHDTTSVLAQKVRLRPCTGRGLMWWYVSAGITLLPLMVTVSRFATKNTDAMRSMWTHVSPHKNIIQGFRPPGHAPRSSSQSWGWPRLLKHFVASGNGLVCLSPQVPDLGLMAWERTALCAQSAEAACNKCSDYRC